MTDRFRKITRQRFLQLTLGAVGAGAALSLGVSPLGAAPGKQRTRIIPKSGEALPVVGLGTAQSFGYASDPADFNLRVEILRTLIEAGGKVIDTSPTYGSAEAVVGRALARLGMRDRSFIATKISTYGKQDGIDQHRGSVRDLKTPNFDLLQVHNLKDTDLHLETIRDLKEQGRVRYVGITHFRDHAYDGLAKVMSAEKLDFAQFNYSIISRKAEERLLPLARDRGIATLINVPFARGRLFGAVRGKALPPWAAEFGAESWGQFFLKYILANPAVTAVIPGSAMPRHMRDNLGAGRGALPDAGHLKRMRQLVSEL